MEKTVEEIVSAELLLKVKEPAKQQMVKQPPSNPKQKGVTIAVQDKERNDAEEEQRSIDTRPKGVITTKEGPSGMIT